MSTLKPTVGRIVLFRMATEVVFPAIITKVVNGDTIELEVFGTMHTKVHYNVLRGDKVFEWDWMEFTKDQAARPGFGDHDKALEEDRASKVPGIDHPMPEEEMETESGVDATGKHDIRQVK